MSRYIDADALITDLNKGLWGKDWDKVLAEAIINEAPSINIVRCFECKHWTYEELCEFFTKPMCFDDFCSYGQKERASDEGMQ